MATYSIAEAQERLPDFLERAAQGEEVVISPGLGRPVALTAVPLSPGPMTPEELACLRAERVKPRPGAPSGPELVRAMRDED